MSTNLDIDPFITTLTWTVFLLPLLSFIIATIVTERYSWIAPLLTTFTLFAAACCASALLLQHWNEGPAVIEVSWFSVGDSHFSANLALSNQSVLMLFVVAVVSFLVHLYSIGYMASDAGPKRYFAMLGFFTFAMNGIVLADSLLIIFIFWELVGFSSYMLIGHYLNERESGSASKKAFIMNRIGDAGFLVGLMIIWATTGTFNLSEIFSDGFPNTWQAAASLCIFCGVIGKSAQFPLFTWLPDAMQGPTPVSALIHAATMVAAGVYLTVRVFPIFNETSLTIVALTGSITAVIGALGALSQFDIKRILAYSTISQLGLMITAVGVGLPDAALLHLFTHAFFKACLFLCAGAVIHALHHAQHHGKDEFDVQDIRNMGGLAKQLPVTLVAFLISGASLAGIPFFSGFVSKEAILTAIWTHTTMVSLVMFVLIISVSFLTVVYTFRLIWFIFFAKATRPLLVTEVPMIMRAPVVLLAACSFWFIVSWNPLDFTGWPVPFPPHQPSVGITLFSIIWVAIAIGFSWFVFRKGTPKSIPVFIEAFYFDRLYKYVYRNTVVPIATQAEYTDRRVIDRAIHFGVYAQVTFAHMVGWFDTYVIDGIVTFFATLSRGFGSLARNFQSGKIQLYIFWGVFAIIIFLICILN